MYSSIISLLLFATIMLISISAMPSPTVYQDNDVQASIDTDDAEMSHVVKRQQAFASWLERRNSPLCDYRLQLRPLPLTSALCGYGQNAKVDVATQMNPFKYG